MISFTFAFRAVVVKPNIAKHVAAIMVIAEPIYNSGTLHQATHLNRFDMVQSVSTLVSNNGIYSWLRRFAHFWLSQISLPKQAGLCVHAWTCGCNALHSLPPVLSGNYVLSSSPAHGTGIAMRVSACLGMTEWRASLLSLTS